MKLLNKKPIFIVFFESILTTILKNGFLRRGKNWGKVMNKEKEVTNWAKAKNRKTLIGTKMCHKNPQKPLFL